MIQENITIQMTISDEEVGSERLDEQTTLLMQDLLELGADSVSKPAGGPAEKGRKGEAFTLGALLLVAAPALLPSLIRFIQAWALRGANRRVKIKTPEGLEIEFTPEKKLSEADLLALVEKLTKAQS